MIFFYLHNHNIYLAKVWDVNGSSINSHGCRLTIHKINIQFSPFAFMHAWQRCLIEYMSVLHNDFVEFIQILTNAAPIDANIGWKPVLHHKILLLLKIIYYTYVLTAWQFSRLLNLGYQKLKRYFKTHLSTNLPILDEILVGNLLRIMKHPYLKGWCCICCFPCIRGAASS